MEEKDIYRSKTSEDEGPWGTEGFTEEIPIGKIAGSPHVGKWNSWVCQQGAVWVDRVNRVYLIDEMSTKYAFNVLRFLFKTHPADINNPYANPLVRALVARLRRGWDNDDMQVLLNEHRKMIPTTTWRKSPDDQDL